MIDVLDHLLPSLSAFETSAYWIFGLIALADALVLTGVLIPGVLTVIVGGALAQRGVLDLTDLAWFVTVGSILGAEISFRLGRLLSGDNHVQAAHPVRRARHRLERYGGAGLVLGRVSGTLSGLIPFSAGATPMRYGRFALWNISGALAFSLALLITGYFLGEALGTLGAIAPRVVVLGGIALIALVTLVVIWYRTRQQVPPLFLLAGRLAARGGDIPRVRRWMSAHPRAINFFKARFGTDQFLGLTATVLVALLAYIAIAYADSVFDFLGAEGTITSDTRLANLFYTMRDDRVIAILGWITQIGGPHGVLPLLGGASLALILLRRFDFLGGLWIAAAGNQITVTLLKSFFARPRSDLGYFVETSGSFPSGHAAASVAVWAMLLYLAWRLRLLKPDVAVLLAVIVAALIGGSRIYLVEHYVSDVLNGYLVGALWLTLGIAVCEWYRASSRRQVSGALRGAAAVCFGGGALLAVYLTSTTASTIKDFAGRSTQVVTAPLQDFAQTGLPLMTEVLTGEPRQPVSLTVTAPDAGALADALIANGWINAPSPSIRVMLLAFYDDWTGQPLPDPLVVQTFWDNRPTDLAFALPGTDRPDGSRLHLRFWDSLLRTQDGQTVFVGTIVQEDPLRWTWDTDTAKADTADAALDQLLGVLRAAGLDASRP